MLDIVWSNSSANHTNDLQHRHSIPFSVHVFIAASITFPNTVVMVIYWCMSRKRKKVSNYLIFAQALADMFQAFVAWYECAMETYDRRGSVNYDLIPWKIIYTGLLEYSFALCLLTLMLGAIERFLCITKPFFHKVHVTKTRIIHGSLCVWLISLIPPLTLLGLADFKKQNLNSFRVIVYSYVFDILMLAMIISNLTLLFMSLKVGKAAMDIRIISNRNHKLISNCKKLSQRLQTITKKKMNLVVIFIVMMVAFIVSFLPHAIGRVLFDTGMLNNIKPTDSFILLSVCQITYKGSSVFNPFFTLAMKKDYRNALRRSMRRKRNQISNRVQERESSF